MRILRHPLFLLVAAVAVLSLSACDFSKQRVEWRPGESLMIEGPTELLFPESRTDFAVSGTYFVRGFTIDRNYMWTVNGEPVDEESILREGEYIGPTFEAPGTYEIMVSDGQFSGTLTVTVTAPPVADQVGRLGYDALATALSVAGLADMLNSAEQTFTLLAPTDTAFVRVFDENGNGSIEAGELPGQPVLQDILSYLIITDSVRVAEITGGGGPYETLEGSTISFSMNGMITVDAETIGGETATLYPTSGLADLPAGNGLIHTIDAIPVPPSGSTTFTSQLSDGETITVSGAYLSEGGFVAVHDSTLLGPDGEPFTNDDQPLTSVIGVSQFLEEGLHPEDIEITLFEGVDGSSFDQNVLQTSQTLFAMPHFDTNGNQEYDFVETDGAEDGPYIESGHPVVNSAFITLE